MALDLTDFIVHQLQLHGVRVRSAGGSGKNLMAYCFKGHDRDTASLSIRKADGAFHCFGCGIKGHNWNALAKALGAKQVREEDLPDPMGLMAEGLSKHIQAEITHQTLPFDIEPWVMEKYRGLSRDFLRQLDAHFWYDDSCRVDRLLLPMWQGRELLGYQARRLDADKFKKYYNAPGMAMTRILYPYDYVLRKFVLKKHPSNVVVLVEGAIDALRLLRYKIPALCIMGTNNYSDYKRSLLMKLHFDTIVIATDSDDAGKECRYQTLVPALRDHFYLEHFFPPSGKDPGGMKKSYVRFLEDQVRRLQVGHR